VAERTQLSRQELGQPVEGAGERQDAHGQIFPQLRGNCSPANPSTMRRPPKAVVS
jgi:hypothetical protein